MSQEQHRHEVKICNPTRFPSFFESDHNKLSGVFSPLINQYIGLVEAHFNGTTVFDGSYPGVGDRIGNTEFYDGCLGQLQRGEADFIATPLDYPQDIVNVSQGFIISDEEISFLGAFARPEQTQIADFSESIFTLHWSIYLITLAFLIVFSVLLEIRRQIVTRIAICILK